MSENIHWGQGSSYWQPSRHWLHRGLSFWHRPVRPGREGFVAVVTLWSQVPGFSVHFVFSVYYEYHWDDWNIVENCVKRLSWSHVFVVLRNKEFLIPDSWFYLGILIVCCVLCVSNKVYGNVSCLKVNDFQTKRLFYISFIFYWSNISIS